MCMRCSRSATCVYVLMPSGSRLAASSSSSGQAVDRKICCGFVHIYEQYIIAMMTMRRHMFVVYTKELVVQQHTYI